MSERENKIKCTAFSQEFIEAKKAEKHRFKSYTTIMFEDNEAEYARFLEWIFEQYGYAKGLRFSNISTPGSIQISPELLEISHDKFSYREATREDEIKHLATLKGTRPFDPIDLKGRHVFGAGHFKKRSR